MKTTLIIAAVAAILAAALAWFITERAAENRYLKHDREWQLKWDGMLSANKAAYDAQQQKITESQASAAQQIADADAAYQRILQEQHDAASQTIASYRAGTLRLRKQFTCGIRAAAVATTNAQPTAVLSDEASKCGLSEADVSDLVRLADSANAVAAQLTQAQAVILAWYKQINGKELTYADH